MAKLFKRLFSKSSPPNQQVTAYQQGAQVVQAAACPITVVHPILEGQLQLLARDPERANLFTSVNVMRRKPYGEITNTKVMSIKPADWLAFINGEKTVEEAFPYFTDDDRTFFSTGVFADPTQECKPHHGQQEGEVTDRSS